MSVDLLVDWVVIIWGCLILITLILAIVFGLLVFKQVKTLNNSIKGTMEIAKQARSDIAQALNSSKGIFSSLKSETVRNGKKPVCEEDKEETTI